MQPRDASENIYANNGLDAIDVRDAGGSAGSADIGCCCLKEKDIYAYPHAHNMIHLDFGLNSVEHDSPVRGDSRIWRSFGPCEARHTAYK